jgi:hypothetical protein
MRLRLAMMFGLVLALAPSSAWAGTCVGGSGTTCTVASECPGGYCDAVATPTPTVTATPTPTVTATATVTVTATPTPTLTPTPTVTATAHVFVDNYDGTVTDNFTALQWEQKTTVVGSGVDFASPHDVDNRYTWGANSERARSSTQFLEDLNTDPACFAGHCDWRLPTRSELEGLLSSPYPCGSHPCISATFGGSTQSARYWTSTVMTVTTAADHAWSVDFNDGDPDAERKTLRRYIRAVRP